MKSPRVVTAAVAVVAAAMLAGCADGSNGGSGDPSENLSVEIMLPYPESVPLAPLLVAKSEGFFTDNGVDVTISVADGSGYLSQQLVAGNVDFALMAATDAVVSLSKRDDVRVLFCNQIESVYRIVAVAGSGVESVDDLAGLALGFTEPGGGEYQLISAALTAAGLEQGTDVQLLPIGGAGPQSLSAIQDGQVQAYSSSFPDIAVLASQGVEWVDITPEKYSRIPGSCMTTTEEALSTEEGLAKAIAISKAWIDGLYFIIDDPERGLEISCEQVPSGCENKEVAEALYAEGWKIMNAPEGHRPGELDPQAWKTVVEVLAANGTVDAGLDIVPLISGDRVDEVVAAAYAGR